MNHQDEYWALVAQYCPDHKLHRRWLNENKDAIFADVTLTYSEEPAKETSVQQYPQSKEQEEPPCDL